MRAIAINVGANTNEPGFRAPIDGDGEFTFLPIPEPKPTRKPVPTYGDLAPALDISVPDAVHDTPVHLDPEFADYPCGSTYTYGDEHGVKARPLSELNAGDILFFYATLSVTEPADWLPERWGAFLIGHFRLAADPVVPERPETLPPDHEGFASNAHLKRDPPDPAVLLRGAPSHSRLYDNAIPLSQQSGGVDPNWLVTELSADSGRGPWWRRPLQFDPTATETLRDIIRESPDAVF